MSAKNQKNLQEWRNKIHETDDKLAQISAELESSAIEEWRNFLTTKYNRILLQLTDANDKYITNIQKIVFSENEKDPNDIGIKKIQGIIEFIRNDIAIIVSQQIDSEKPETEIGNIQKILQRKNEVESLFSQLKSQISLLETVKSQLNKLNKKDLLSFVKNSSNPQKQEILLALKIIKLFEENSNDTSFPQIEKELNQYKTKLERMISEELTVENSDSQNQSTKKTSDQTTKETALIQEILEKDHIQNAIKQIQRCQTLLKNLEEKPLELIQTFQTTQNKLKQSCTKSTISEICAGIQVHSETLKQNLLEISQYEELFKKKKNLINFLDELSDLILNFKKLPKDYLEIKTDKNSDLNPQFISEKAFNEYKNGWFRWFKRIFRKIWGSSDLTVNTVADFIKQNDFYPLEKSDPKHAQTEKNRLKQKIKEFVKKKKLSEKRIKIIQKYVLEYIKNHRDFIDNYSKRAKLISPVKDSKKKIEQYLNKMN